MRKEAEITFDCPDEMKYACSRVLQGEYDIPYSPEVPPRVLDIGANCGAFSVWAAHRWPDCKIFAYEPAQVCFPYLQKNTSGIRDISLNQVAVLASERKKLYVGIHNQGEASFFPELGQTSDSYELPQIIHPRDLPEAEVLKLDTEGCEVEILEWLLAGHAPRVFEVIMFEYHGDEDRRYLDDLLSKHYLLSCGEAVCAHRGTMKYVRRTK